MTDQKPRLERNYLPFASLRTLSLLILLLFMYPQDQRFSVTASSFGDRVQPPCFHPKCIFLSLKAPRFGFTFLLHLSVFFTSSFCLTTSLRPWFLTRSLPLPPSLPSWMVVSLSIFKNESSISMSCLVTIQPHILVHLPSLPANVRPPPSPNMIPL